MQSRVVMLREEVKSWKGSMMGPTPKTITAGTEMQTVQLAESEEDACKGAKSQDCLDWEGTMSGNQYDSVGAALFLSPKKAVL